MKVKITLLYSEATLEFDDVEVGFLEGNMVLAKESHKETINTVFPLHSIAYYTIIEPKEEEENLVSLKLEE